MATHVRFDVCSCERHGRIVLDDTPGDEIYLKRVARIAVQCAYERKQLTRSQAVELNVKIAASSLSCQSEEIVSELAQRVRTWNASRKGALLEPSQFHTFLEQQPPR